MQNRPIKLLDFVLFIMDSDENSAVHYAYNLLNYNSKLYLANLSNLRIFLILHSENLKFNDWVINIYWALIVDSSLCFKEYPYMFTGELKL